MYHQMFPEKLEEKLSKKKYSFSKPLDISTFWDVHTTEIKK